VHLFETAGFVDVKAQGDLSGAPYSLSSKSLAAIGRKGGAD
jgi:hypothetical protein